MMFNWKRIIILPVLIAAIVISAGCGSASSTTQHVQVEKGDLSVIINGSGEVTAENDAKPSFGSGGEITNIFVKEGDKVSKGDILARMKTDTLELSLAQALLAQKQAEVALTQTSQAETQAQIALTSAQFNLDLTEDVAEIKDSITDLQWQITIAEMRIQEARAIESDVKEYWTDKLEQYNTDLIKYQKKLAELLSQDEYSTTVLYNIYGQKYDRITLEDIHLKQLQVESAEISVQQAKLNVEQAQRALDQANVAVIVAQNQLDDATVTAPISGTIINLNVKQGETLLSTTLLSTIPIYVADLNSLIISATVDEIDVAQVEVGQKVIIRLDSDETTDYEGTVKSISQAPVTNDLSSGIVTYEVKVTFVKTPPDKVKLGMTAEINIITEEHSNILVIPTRALNQDDNGNYIVNVMVGEKTETRQVEIGISDGIDTEIVSGLSEGETVVIIRATEGSAFFGQ